MFDHLAQHNLKQMLDLGLVATVNSDDPAYFGGYLNQNFIETFEALPLSASDALTWRATAEASLRRPIESACSTTDCRPVPEGFAR